MSLLEQSIQKLNQKIAQLCTQQQRDWQDVTLLAVSKGQRLATIQSALPLAKRILPKTMYKKP